jgi:hypothetical protein
MSTYSKTLPTKEDISQPGISHLDTRHLPEVKSDVSHVCLHLLKGKVNSWRFSPVIAEHGENFMKLWASSDTTFGKRAM